MPQLFNVQMKTQDVAKIQLEQSGRTSTTAAKAESENSFQSTLQQNLPENSSRKKKSPDGIDVQQNTNTQITDQTIYQTFLGQQDSANTIFPQVGSQPNQPDFATTTATQSDSQELSTIGGRQQSQSPPPALFLQNIVQASPAATSPQQEALLKRLQAILNSGAEAGVLSIKKVQEVDSGSPLRSQHLNLTAVEMQKTAGSEIVTNSPVTKGAGFTALQEGVFAPTLRNRQQQLEGVRHDKTQQFYDAKTQPQNILTEHSNLADRQQGDEMNGQGSGFSRPASLTTNPEGTSTFSLPVNQGADPPATQLVETSKASMFPSGALVQDQEVIQQIVERFRGNKRLLESKIQLKLHPVELGKLEIDLTVKEGSIRANVVAQSQHVQDILEKNIARLKSILEQQGFSVEEISITSGSETVDGFDLFEQQLNNSETPNFQKKNEKTETHTPFVLDEFQESYVESPSGINVKV